LLEYYNDNTAVNLELLVLSGGYTVTGRTPTCLIRDKDTGNYFDFASNTFTGVTTSATAILNSAIDGLYTYSWDISGQFSSESGSHLTFEYHDATSVAIEHVLVSPKLRLNVAGGGPIGDIIIKGRWTKEQKDRLFGILDNIKDKIETSREKILILLRRLLTKKTLQKEDLDEITKIKERDLKMYQELLKILDLKNTADEKEVFAKLEEYIKLEEIAKTKVLDKLNTFLSKKDIPQPKVEDKDDDEDDD